MNKLFSFGIPDGLKLCSNLWVAAPTAERASEVMRAVTNPRDHANATGPQDVTEHWLGHDKHNLAELLSCGVVGVVVKEIPFTNPQEMVAGLLAGLKPNMSGSVNWKVTPTSSPTSRQ